jgi:hypothetical protein
LPLRLRRARRKRRSLPNNYVDTATFGEAVLTMELLDNATPLF